jgi:HSP20 family protein
MEKEFHYMIEAVVRAATDAYGQSCWCPAVDIYRGRREWLLKFDLAGVRPEDIELVLEGRELVVRGVRRDMTLVEGQRAYSMEIAYNRFERRVELPCGVENIMLRSDYRDGMFLVTITAEASA